MVCVSDEQILAAIRLSGRHGVFAEPAAAAALAGVVEAVDQKNHRTTRVGVGDDNRQRAERHP